MASGACWAERSHEKPLTLGDTGRGQGGMGQGTKPSHTELTPKGKRFCDASKVNRLMFTRNNVIKKGKVVACVRLLFP